MSKVIEITTENFETEVLNSEKPVFVDFWAEWCGPCKMVSPIIDQIADEVSSVKIGKVNVDEQPTLASNYGIMSIPTMLLFKNGQIANKSVGAKSKAELMDIITG